jgi:hypothetical protein
VQTTEPFALGLLRNRRPCSLASSTPAGIPFPIRSYRKGEPLACNLWSCPRRIFDQQRENERLAQPEPARQIDPRITCQLSRDAR